MEQAVQMNDEIAHRRVVDRCPGHRLPSPQGLRVAGIKADDMKLGRIGEFRLGATPQLSAENQMEKLFVRRMLVGH